MGEITGYFTHHYTLVLDNDQETWNEVTRAARDVVIEHGPTRSEYLGMSSNERVSQYALEIGTRILDMIDGWLERALPDRDSVGALLIREIMITSGGGLAWELGEHYMPEDADIADSLDDDEECEGHESLNGADMGRTVHCDGSCR